MPRSEEDHLPELIQETHIRNTQILELASTPPDTSAAPFRGSHSPGEELHKAESCCKHLHPVQEDGSQVPDVDLSCPPSGAEVLMPWINSFLVVRGC